MDIFVIFGFPWLNNTNRKMKPLVTSHRYLTWLCLCTPDESSNKWHKRAYIIFTTSILIILLSHIIADTAFCLIMLPTNLQSCLFVILCIAGDFCTTYSLILGLLLMPHKIDKILKNLQTLYSTCKYSKTSRFRAEVICIR